MRDTKPATQCAPINFLRAPSIGNHTLWFALATSGIAISAPPIIFRGLSNPSLTKQQLEAAAARGNVLVVAGAGAGKTRTLVERCLAWLLDANTPGSVDELLMVTFTQAAAAEMRKRLRDGLERAPSNAPRLAEQLALLDTARICTLHSFCFELVSQHFYELGLDPQLTVLSNEESHSLERRAMDGVLEKIYDSKEPGDAAIQKLIQITGGDGDKPLRDLIIKLHHYGQTLRDPDGWFASQKAMFESPEPREWKWRLLEALEHWRETWLPILESQPSENTNAAKCAIVLKMLKAPVTPKEWAAAMADIKLIDQDWARARKKWRDPIEDFFEESEFLDSLCATPEAADPLLEDWNWARPSMLALLDVARRFADAHSQAKRNFGGIDFHDLEQFALRLLWNGSVPSAIAMQWRAKLRLIFVDEFQDINAAQEAIILALAREGAAANRFLVGDVKQSIYRFRLADPRIFVKYKADWELAGAAGKTLLLSENFRSHEGILNFVNGLFSMIMRKNLGGVEYDEAAKLIFGDRERRAEMANSDSAPPPVELLLRRKGDAAEDEENASDAEKEARMVGRRLLELHRDATKPVAWSEMVILLRAPKNKTAPYAKEFNRLGIPLAAARGGFFDSPEARDFLGLLQLLDNPLQDLPLLGVLRSPIVGITDGELAEIRISHPRGRFWEALVEWHGKNQTAPLGAVAKAGRFLQRYHEWRAMARQEPVSQSLETLLDATHYADWLETQTRGEQGRANLERLLQLARQFDTNRGESLSRFLGFMEAQQESDDESEPAPTTEDAVRLMSIHQSKGLEFPVVVVADLGKRFNFRDLSAKIILDEELGLCPRVRPPDAFQTWPSLPYWVAQRRQKRELVGEELRLLYVAMTRAEKRLILAGTASQKAIAEKWPKRARAGPDLAHVLAAAGFLDWIGSWPPGGADFSATGRNAFFQWTVCDDDHPWLARAEIVAPETNAPSSEFELTPETRERLDWQYAFTRETHIPAKASVSALRREMAPDALEETRVFRFDTRPKETADGFGASEIGLAHHAFLEKMSLERAGTLESLQRERSRMEVEKALSPQELASLDLDALAAFWNSDVGRQIVEHRAEVRRELAFTARFGVDELSALGAAEFGGAAADEFVIVQGVIDLAVFLPNEIWLLDFKTDHFNAAERERKIDAYRPQIELYAAAVARIYGKPVTNRWLHFIASRHTAALGVAAPAQTDNAAQMDLPGLVSERPVR